MKEISKILLWKVAQIYIAIGIAWMLLLLMGELDNFPFNFAYTLLMPVIALMVVIPIHIYDYRKHNKS